jgi:hypothetical protein
VDGSTQCRSSHKEHRLLSGDAQQDRQQGVEGLLFLLLRRHRQRRIIRRQRQGEEGGQEGRGLGQWQAILHQESLQFTHLLFGGFLPFEAQDHPLQ